MTIDAVPPALVLILVGFVLPAVRETWRPALMLAAPLIALALVWSIGDGPQMTLGFLDYILVPVAGDALSRLFGTIFAIMAFAGGLF